MCVVAMIVRVFLASANVRLVCQCSCPVLSVLAVRSGYVIYGLTCDEMITIHSRSRLSSAPPAVDQRSEVLAGVRAQCRPMECSVMMDLSSGCLFIISFSASTLIKLLLVGACEASAVY